MDNIIIPFPQQRGPISYHINDDSLETLLTKAHQKAEAYLELYDQLATPQQQALFRARLKSRRQRARNDFDSIAIASTTIALKSICAPAPQSPVISIIDAPYRAVTPAPCTFAPDTLG